MNETAQQPSSEASRQIRDHFVGWQCRIRQMVMRKSAGRPSEGMRPRLLLPDGEELSPGVVIVMVPQEPEESTEFFRFQLHKTHDPNQIYEKGLEYLQSTHYHNAKQFSDQMTALFGNGSGIVSELRASGQCILEFAQFSQSYRMLCTVSELEPADPAYQATLWHNKIFNPNIPGDVHIIGFQPDWASVQADPAP